MIASCWCHTHTHTHTRKITDLSVCKDLPEEIPMPLIIGTKVTGQHTHTHTHTRNSHVNSPNELSCFVPALLDEDQI